MRATRRVLSLTVAALLALPFAGASLADSLASRPAGVGKPDCPGGKGKGHDKCEVTDPGDGGTTGTSRVVVADIDTGINPYHEFFYTQPASVTPEVLAEFGVDAAHVVTLTRTGDFAADYAADKPFWDSVKEGELYHFTGTNIIATTFDPGERPIMPDDEGDTHGVGTAAAVLKANPEAVLLFVEGWIEESETFAFSHPAVDIVTTSYGFVTSVPLPWHLTDSYKGVVENGKLHFGAAANDPSPSPFDSTSGPWWTVGIAGFEEGTSEGRQVMSGNAPDFVADFTQDLPYCAECESGEDNVGGTSFATPRSAGTASAVLLAQRRDAGHVGGITGSAEGPAMVVGDSGAVTNWEIRRALEEAAYYPSAAEYDPVDGVLDFAAVPVVDPVAWAQTGWGALTPDPEHGVIAEALAQLAGAEPRKGADACAFNTAMHEARHAYWDYVAVDSQSWMAGQDPYLHC